MEKRIKIVDNDISVDIGKLKRIITHDWPELLRHFYKLGYRGEELYFSVLNEMESEAEDLFWEIEKIAQKILNMPDIDLDRADLYPKSDIRSMEFEILSFLEYLLARPIEGLTTEDIPFILEILDTSADQSLEAWNKWEKYWGNLDYPARRKKLLEDPKYNYRTPFYVALNTKSHGDIEQAQDLLYTLIKEFAPKQLVAEGDKIVKNGELRVLYQYEGNWESFYIEVSDPNSVERVAPSNLVGLKKTIKEGIEKQKRKFGNPVHPRVITDIIRNS